MSECADMVTGLPPPFLSFVSLGPGREVRNGMGWSLLEKTAGSGVWFFRGALRESSAFFALAAFADWVQKGSFLTAWAVLPLFWCSCSYLYGRDTAVGPQSGKRCWPLLERLWRASAPLVKPWCAEGDVPTAANLNLYQGRTSYVGWHSDVVPLFGDRGEAKLIVSVSFGTQALFKWKGKSCPNNDGHSCWLGHGDILVMDGQCQDEFRHCTDPGSDQERINITFRWVKQHVASCSFLRTGVACCLPLCARGFSFSGTELVEKGSCLAFWLLLGAFCILGVPALLVISLVCTRFGFQRCASYWTRPEGGGRRGHYPCYPWGVCWAAQKSVGQMWYGFCGSHYFKLYVLASVGRPSLHSYDACVVYWVQGTSWRNCRQNQGKTSFSPKKVFLFSRNPQKRFWCLVFWYLWIGRAKNPGPGSPHHLAVEVFNVGGWLTHGDLALDAGLDFLAVTEHRLIPARARSEWAGLRSKGARPGVLTEPEPQEAATVGYVAAPGPLLVVASLAGGDEVDATTVSYLLKAALVKEEEEEERRKQEEQEEFNSLYAMTVRTPQQDRRLADLYLLRAKRKRKKRRKRRTPRTSSRPLCGRARRRQWQWYFSGSPGDVLLRAVFPSVVVRNEMPCIMAGMDLKDRFSGMCTAGFPGYVAPRAVFPSVVVWPEMLGNMVGQLCAFSWQWHAPGGYCWCFNLFFRLAGP